MKKTILSIFLFMALIVAPFISVNNTKADNASDSMPSSEVRAGFVVQVNQEASLSVYIVRDEVTGNIYISEATDLSFRVGDSVSYSAGSCDRIIVRPVIRK